MSISYYYDVLRTVGNRGGWPCADLLPMPARTALPPNANRLSDWPCQWVCGRFLNVQTSKQRVKNWQLVGGTWRRKPSHGTTGTLVNLTLSLTADEIFSLDCYIPCQSALGGSAKLTLWMRKQTYRFRPSQSPSLLPLLTLLLLAMLLNQTKTRWLTMKSECRSAINYEVDYKWETRLERLAIHSWCSVETWSATLPSSPSGANWSGTVVGLRLGLPM